MLPHFLVVGSFGALSSRSRSEISLTRSDRSRSIATAIVEVTWRAASAAEMREKCIVQG